MDLGFDIYAMVKPKTKADYIALLDEALSLIQQVNEQLDAVFEACQAEQDKKRQ
ncbi:hypothetical protein [Variovorax sp. PBL-E5]|uniref:hypothetical protein n=2 Tax=Variovorax TaxID=34072 RepID=UPI0013A5B7D6|nr:hypothetical protein [Variovorax sp. PBL-E5]